MRRSTCPIANSLDLWGDKWSLLILRDMIFEKKQHYGDFLQSAEKISTNILADRLLRLEEAGLIRKQQDETNKTRKIYTITAKGIDLIPAIVEIALWSLRYYDFTELAPEIIAALEADKEGFIQVCRDRLMSTI